MRKTLIRILAHFNLGTLRSYRKAGGHAGKNFFVETHQGSYLVKIVLTGSDASNAGDEDGLRVLQYLDRLTLHSFRNVPYLRASDGSHAFKDASCRAMVQKKLNATAPKRLTPKMIAQIGEEMARLHLVPSGGLAQRVTWMHPAYLKDASDLVSAAYLDREHVSDLVASVAADTVDWTLLPKSILHGDMFQDNTLFRHGRLVTFIDWEDVCLGPSVFDIGMTIVGNCFSDDSHLFEPDLYHAFMAGYESVRRLSPSEKSLLASAVRRAGVSLAIWRFLKWNHYDVQGDQSERYKSYWQQKLDTWEPPV